MNIYEITRPSETYVSRFELLTRLIESSRAELQLKPLDEKSLAQSADQWDKRLSPIPTHWLERAYDLAMQNRDSRNAIIPREVLNFWQSSLAEAYNREVQATDERLNCEYACTVDGWITINADGTLWEVGSEQNTTVKPCPNHRPRAWAVEGLTQAQYEQQCRARERANRERMQ